MKQFLFLLIIITHSFGYEAFISPSNLKKALKDESLIIFDTSSTALYKQGHIDGAIHVNVYKFINQESPYKLMHSTEIIQDELVNLGINKDSNIVIYSHNSANDMLNSSYLALILISHGFENVSILDGGYMAWVFENELLISSFSSSAKDDGNFKIKAKKNLLVTFEFLQNNLDKITMLDARSSEYYYGIKRSKNIKSVGHIKYAKSSYYKDKFYRDNTLRVQGELTEIYVYGHELGRNDNIIVYADDIFKASMEWYILYQQMGFKNTKVYEASLMEWGNYNLPMTRFKWE